MTTKQIIKQYWDDFLRAYYCQEYPGCPNGHNSFWKSVLESQEWQAWKKYNKNGNWDFAENEELGILSPEHWRAFVGFIKKLK